MTTVTKVFKAEMERDLDDYYFAEKEEKEKKRVEYLNKWQNRLSQSKTVSQIKTCNLMIKIFS